MMILPCLYVLLFSRIWEFPRDLSVPTHFTNKGIHSDQYFGSALCYPILIWGAIPTKPYPFLLLQHIIHKLWGIKYTIFSMVPLDHHYLTLSLPIKDEFLLSNFSSIYSHLVLDSYLPTVVVNRKTSIWELLRWRWFTLRAIEPIWIPQYVVICRHQMYRQKITLLEITPPHSIILDHIILLCWKWNFKK